jgi:hypothetical protein
MTRASMADWIEIVRHATGQPRHRLILTQASALDTRVKPAYDDAGREPLFLGVA